MLLVEAALVVGLWVLFLPRVFYDNLPLPGRYRVSVVLPTMRLKKDDVAIAAGKGLKALLRN